MGTREQAQTNRDDPANRRLFLIDESSLTSTQQMKDFLDRLGPLIAFCLSATHASIRP
jgi:phosphate starvation-inducible protein PhoH